MRRAIPLAAALYAALLLVSGVLLASTSDARAETTFVVTSTGDSEDISVGDGICDVDDSTLGSQCTLRAAIQEANSHPGPDTIAFSIPGEGVQTIQLTKALPELNDETGPTTIDGYTQPGSSPNTDSFASNAKITVQIEGAGHAAFDGLRIVSEGNVVRGLAFYKLGKSLILRGSTARDNRIAGNFIGTDAAGTYGSPIFLRFVASGVHISEGASSNIVGGTSAADRNVISGNATDGINIRDDGTNSNLVVGNIVGLDPSGNARLPNRAHGVDMNGGASYNVIGGTAPGERNVISGNSNEGVEVSHETRGITTTGNQIIGNFIGTDVTGTYGPSFAYNAGNGVFLEDGANDSVVRDNVIGNNNFGGVKISRPDTIGNQVYGNRIGISLDGTPIPNRVAGVRILEGAQRSQIGPDNIIANNPIGVLIGGSDTTFNRITGNSIYGNTGLGIDIEPFEVVNKNDPGDGDTGANQQQNSPVLTAARTARGKTVIKGNLNSTPNSTFMLEFFSNRKGEKEGTRFIGSKSVSTAADGKISFSFRASQVVRAGRPITATATDSGGNTSEFSAARIVKRKRS